MPKPVALPHREPRALQQRTRLVDPHARRACRLSTAAADDTERGAVAHARERAGVAVREHRARRRGTSAAPCAPMRRLRATSSAAIAFRVVERAVCATAFVRVERLVDTSTRGSPRSDASAAIRAAAARTCRFVRSVCAASATPYAPAAPSAGAPRTARVAIASIERVDVSAVDEPHPRRQRALVEQAHRRRAAIRSSAGSGRTAGLTRRRSARKTELRVRCAPRASAPPVHAVDPEVGLVVVRQDPELLRRGSRRAPARRRRRAPCPSRCKPCSRSRAGPADPAPMPLLQVVRAGCARSRRCSC